MAFVWAVVEPEGTIHAPPAKFERAATVDIGPPGAEVDVGSDQGAGAGADGPGPQGVPHQLFSAVAVRPRATSAALINTP